MRKANQNCYKAKAVEKSTAIKLCNSKDMFFEGIEL